jgi:anti-anti-sigma regulatory factor
MPTRITQVDNAGTEPRKFKLGRKCDQLNSSDIESLATVLKVEGTLHLRDAELLERICRDVAIQSGHPVTLDLASISFIDSDSASVLCRLKREQGVTLEGLRLFIEKVIELAEAADRAAKYLPRTGDSA